MDNELKHFGVPGMKWGVRKEQYKNLNRSQKKELKKYSRLLLSRKAKDKVEAKNLKKKLEDALKIKINSQSAGKERAYTRGLIAVSTILAGGLAFDTIYGIKARKEAKERERLERIFELGAIDMHNKIRNPNAISFLNLFKDDIDFKKMKGRK